MRIKNDYDIVVYGGSVSAVRYAIHEKSKGKDVLLINSYGFLGGSVTEAFSCLQSIKDLAEDVFTEKMLHENFYNSNDFAILNPEHIKIVLQTELQNSKVDLLFHVFPENILFNEYSAEITLIAKEGIKKINTSKIIDSTEHAHLFSLTKKSENAKVEKVNLFVTKTYSLQLESFGITSIKLTDGRYWISVPTVQKESEFYDFGEHELFSNIEEKIKKYNSRIQLLPARSQYALQNQIISTGNVLLHISSLTEKTFSVNEELLRCQSIIKCK